MAKVDKRPIFSNAAGAGLCLHPPGCCPQGAACSTSTSTQQQVPATTAPANTSPTPQEQQTVRRPLTIVYGDRACTVEVTEAQALEILFTARQGLGQNFIASDGGGGGGGSRRTDEPDIFGLPEPQLGTCSSGSVLGQSMKGSLQRFLEKRAARKVASSPYSTTPALRIQSSPFVCQGM